MINHVTYHISRDALKSRMLTGYMRLLGFEEVEPNDPFEHGYDVRWFRSEIGAEPDQPLIHFVADGASLDVKLGLGHFCVAGVGVERFEHCSASAYCVRNSGSGRIWLEYDRVRAEVRP
jgi:hypothetical protein